MKDNRRLLTNTCLSWLPLSSTDIQIELHIFTFFCEFDTTLWKLWGR